MTACDATRARRSRDVLDAAEQVRGRRWIEIGLLAVGAIILLAGYEKLLGTRDVRPVLVWLGASPSLRASINIVVGTAEVLWGGLLVLFRAGKPSLLIMTVVVLSGYSALLLFLAMGEAAPPCGCLSVMETIESTRLANALGCVRNVILLVPCIAALYGEWSAPNLSRE